VYKPINVVRAAADKVVLKIPADMTIGAYARVRVITSDALTRFLTGVSITVTE
jgi:hypothetical protein